MQYNSSPTMSCLQISRANSARRNSIAVALVSLVVGGSAFAQTTYERLYAFGDSYADSGYNLVPLLGGNTSGYPSQGHSPQEVARNFSYVAYPYWLQAHLGINDSEMMNYAIGSSTTQPLNGLGLPYSGPFQMATWNERKFTDRDLITVSFGGNDGIVPSGLMYSLYGIGPTGVNFGANEAVATAELAVTNVTDFISRFVSAGAKNIVIGGFSDMSELPGAAGIPHPESLEVYGQAYYQRLQEELRPIALNGTRIFLLDESRIIARMRDNLGAYGFSSLAYAGPTEVPSIVGPDGVHLTTHGFEVLAKYMASAVMAPTDFSLLSQSSLAATQSFSNSLVNRLDAQRSLHSMQSNPVGTVTSYALGGYSARNGDNHSAVDGSDYHSSSGTVGAEVQLSPSLLAGLAFSYGKGKNRPDSGGRLEDEATQVASYLSYDDAQWFGDVLLGYGHHNLDLNRRGIIESVGGSTDADTFSAAMRGGYLFDFGLFSAGPLLGIEYQRSEVDGYSESGDPFLAFDVDGQTQKSLLSTAGIHMRAPFVVGNQRIASYLNLAWKHQFEDSRGLVSTLQQSPLLPIHTDVQDYESRDYGVLGGGLAVSLSSDLNLEFSASTEFGREGGNGYQLGTSLSYSF